MPPQILPLLGSSSSGSSASAKMQSRDHPFNRSTRPLLERRAQPQVVSTKKLLAAQSAPGPKVPTRGYNDFNLISRQYETWNSNHSHQGYPYGSPPSPTHDSGVRGDFQFSDLVDGPQQRAQHHQRTVHQYTVNSNNSDDDDDYDELVYHHNQLNVGGGGVGGPAGVGLKTANQQLRRRLLDAASPMPPVPPQRTMQQQQHHRTPPPPPRRTESPPMAPVPVRGLADIDGPFVFGVHHPNTFTPAYGTKATLYGTNTTTVSSTISKDGKDPSVPSSPDTSQVGPGRTRT
ncbi:AGAP003931-PA-like protein [Anopheles sinensis]|uniref:AGAP003931-PA-like protein n=1 Tax=Anopheles sinensis TaxID=74873 RepID=A0A084W927_ANOSI|nr:AGAP003931-PA-like protein [Anopheles sinensis]